MLGRKYLMDFMRQLACYMGFAFTRHLRATLGVAVPQFTAMYAESQDERHECHDNSIETPTATGRLRS